MNQLSFFTLLFAVLFMAARCDENSASKPLDGNWNCTQISGLGKPELATPTLRLEAAEKRATGNGGCNAWFASYESDGAGTVKFGGIGATKMACNDGRAQIESAFFNALREADSYQFGADGRLILSKGKSALAEFEKE